MNAIVFRYTRGFLVLDFCRRFGLLTRQHICFDATITSETGGFCGRLRFVYDLIVDMFVIGYQPLYDHGKFA